MKRNINLLGIALIMLSFFAFSGLDCESGGIELRVVTTGDNFSGYYIIDGGKEHFFIGNVNTNGFRYSKNLGTFKHVEISVTKDRPSATMDLYLYDQNGDVIQKINNASCDIGGTSTSACTNSSSMSYTFQTVSGSSGSY